jgi:glutamate-ammonia-ligase adenylyltransferase
MALSDELSALADTILAVALETAANPPSPLGEGQGEGRTTPSPLGEGRGEGLLPGFIVVGYGKLGGKELGYGSDLDIVFLFDDRVEAKEPLPRIAQRVNTWLTSQTSAGVLYETDLRLRPDGASGLLVSSINAFREYQLSRAWTWEHQALTRARYCAGDASLGERFESVRDEILAKPRDVAKLYEEIESMRRKMRAEQKSKDDLKHVEGGVIDLEFCVQALVLAHGPAHPQLRENKGNHTLLRRAAELGLVEEDIAVDAANAYLAMRALVHQAALNDEDTVRVKPGVLDAEREAVRRLRSRLFGPAAR